MTYPIIDLEKLIADCDPRQQVILNRFSSFSNHSLDTLRKANDFYAVLPINFIGLSQKTKSDAQRDFRNAIDNIDHQAFQAQSDLYFEDQKKQKSHAWYVNQKQLLEDPSFWHACEVSCQNQAQLEKLKTLKKHWQTHSLPDFIVF